MTAASPFLVLHVCTGNICRSPMAELLMRAELDEAYGAAAGRVVLDGGGTYAGHAGEAINPPAGEALQAFGVDGSVFRAQSLGRRAIESADLVVCASREHAHRVVTMVPAAADRTFTLLDLADLAEREADRLPVTPDPALRLEALRDLARTEVRAPSTGSDIEDPYGRSAAVYEATARQIRAAVQLLVGHPPGPAASVGDAGRGD